MTSPVSAVETKPRRFSNDRNPNGLGYSNGVVEDDLGYYVLHSDYEALASQAEALKRRAEAAEALVERMRQVAQAKTMEARTANSTIREIYQIVSSGKGEPGNWHGAEPVRAKLEALQRENAELRRLVENGQSFANQVRSITYRLNGQAYSSAVSELNQFDAVLRRARTLLKEEANAE